jgi:hypothetical protein
VNVRGGGGGCGWGGGSFGRSPVASERVSGVGGGGQVSESHDARRVHKAQCSSRQYRRRGVMRGELSMSILELTVRRAHPCDAKR